MLNSCMILSFCLKLNASNPVFDALSQCESLVKNKHLQFGQPIPNWSAHPQATSCTFTTAPDTQIRFTRDLALRSHTDSAINFARQEFDSLSCNIQ